MRSGWGEFGWTQMLKPERVCRECSQPIKKIGDVAEVREVYPGRKKDLLCTACAEDRVRILVESERARLEISQAHPRP